MRKLLLLTLALPVLVVTVAATVQAQTYSVLYNFGTNTGDPQSPLWFGVFAQGRDGNLYSTSQAGGIGYGTVFQLTPAGEVKVLYQFPLGTNSHGGSPQGGLTLGTDGYLYGTTLYLGSSGAGSVFKIATDGTPPTTLYSFTPGISGYIPYTAPIQGIDGNFYGTTAYGHTTGLTGSVYKMTPAGVLTTLYEFDKTHGVFPTALIQGTDSNFYGTTLEGGTGTCVGGCGVIFKLTAAGQFTVLHNFTGTDGYKPYGPIIQASDGNFYGTTSLGGSGNCGSGCGVVYKMTPAGLTVLVNFAGTHPIAGLVQANDGKFYGAVISAVSGGAGSLYQITSSGNYTTLYTFTNSTGNAPFVSLFQNTNGILYGDTASGGTGKLCNRCGVAYSLDMDLSSFVSFVGPLSSGKVGRTIEFLGQGFTGTTGVSFNGTAATFTVKSSTYLTAAVPNGARTGFVKVTTPGGTLTSNKKFRVTPQITSFNPTSGPVGTSVTITGVSLKQTTKVTFGGVAATTITVNSDTTVTATVPSGAVTGKITITTAGGTATNATLFTVTP